MNQSKNTPSSLFNLQRGEPHDQSVTNFSSKKRETSVIFTLPEFNINTDEKPIQTIQKALSVLKNGRLFLHRSRINQKDETFNFVYDSNSVSTASTSSVSSISSAGDESDIDTNQEKEVPITSLTPDTLFIVQGKEFPCHAQLLSEQARPLHDILSRDGVLERKTKKQRASSSSLPDKTEGEDQMQTLSSPSGITVVRLPNNVEADYFEFFMEFLYTKEINLRLLEGYQEGCEEDDPWLMDEEEIIDDDDSNEDDENDLQLLALSPSEDDESTGLTALKLLQGFFSFASSIGCTSLKAAIENKIYDEFLFSFTAKDLLLWADQNDCTFLKEKAKEKLPKTL